VSTGLLVTTSFQGWRWAGKRTPTTTPTCTRTSCAATYTVTACQSHLPITPPQNHTHLTLIDVLTVVVVALAVDQDGLRESHPAPGTCV
jgi:hypothetical protein